MTGMNTLSTSWNFSQLLQFFGPKIFFSILCGGIIGLERELKNKPAGIKTNILICVGSALYTSISVLISLSHSERGYYGDPARLAAQIVSGIGFLGGGTIIQARGTVQGLTTAATIWVGAAIGVCVGIGHSDIALFTSVTVVLILVATGIFEDRVLGRALTFACEIVADDPDGVLRSAIHQTMARNELVLDDFDIAEKGAHSLLTMKYRGHRTNHKKFVLELWSTAGIIEVRQV